MKPLAWAKSHPMTIVGVGVATIAVILLAKGSGGKQETVIAATGPSDVAISAQSSLAAATLGYNAQSKGIEAQRDVALAQVGQLQAQDRVAGDVALATIGAMQTIKLSEYSTGRELGLAELGASERIASANIGASERIAATNANRDINVAYQMRKGNASSSFGVSFAGYGLNYGSKG